MNKYTQFKKLQAFKWTCCLEQFKAGYSHIKFLLGDDSGAVMFGICVALGVIVGIMIIL